MEHACSISYPAVLHKSQDNYNDTDRIKDKEFSDDLPSKVLTTNGLDRHAPEKKRKKKKKGTG